MQLGINVTKNADAAAVQNFEPGSMPPFYKNLLLLRMEQLPKRTCRRLGWALKEEMERT
jgi:hypothetical protein